MTARAAALLIVLATLWGAWKADNHTGSCLMLTVLGLIVVAILGMLMAGMSIPS